MIQNLKQNYIQNINNQIPLKNTSSLVCRSSSVVMQSWVLPSILFPLSQSETMESSLPTRSLAGFLAPRNLLVSWPSVPVTRRTAKHKFSKETITRIISSKNLTTSHHAPTSPSSPPLYFFSLFIKFPYTLPQVSSTTSSLSIHLPYLDILGKY